MTTTMTQTTSTPSTLTTMEATGAVVTIVVAKEGVEEAIPGVAEATMAEEEDLGVEAEVVVDMEGTMVEDLEVVVREVGPVSGEVSGTMQWDSLVVEVVVAVEGMEEIWEVLEAVIEDLEVDLEEVVVVVVEVKGLAVSQWIPTALEELRAL